MFVLWYVFRVASHMDISRDVAEGETLMVSAQTPLCLQKTLVALVSGPDVSQGAALPWCLSQACQVKFLHSLFFSKIYGLLKVGGVFSTTPASRTVVGNSFNRPSGKDELRGCSRVTRINRSYNTRLTETFLLSSSEFIYFCIVVIFV